MKILLFVLILFMNSFSIIAQNTNERLKEVELKIKAAVEKEDYNKAAELKKEKMILLKIKEAVNNEDYAKAAALKKELSENSGSSKSGVNQPSNNTNNTSTINRNSEDSDLIKYVAGISYEGQQKEIKLLRDGGKIVEFPFEFVPGKELDYPILRVEDNLPVNPLAQLQGIKVSCSVDYTHEREISKDMDRSEDWEIELFVENQSGKDIYYQNPDDIVSIIKFPGEESDFLDANDELVELNGGTIIFYASMLDKKNGKYLMEAGEEYEWDYTIYRDADSYLEAAFQKKFRPLSISVGLPQENVDASGNKNDLISWRETVSLSSMVISNNGYLRNAYIEFPDHYVDLTPHAPFARTKTTFKKNGQQTIIFEDHAIRVELNSISDIGKVTYTVSNLTDQKLSLGNNDLFGQILYSNGERFDLFLSLKNNFAIQKLDPFASYSNDYYINAPTVSGEFFVEKDRKTRRKTIQKSIVPVQFILIPIDGVQYKEEFESNKIAINILHTKNPKNPGAISGSMYFKDAVKHELKRGQVVQVQLSESGYIKWITMAEYHQNFSYKQKNIDKWLGDKPGIFGNYVTNLNAEMGKQYYFVLTDDEDIHSVTKEKWDSIIKDSSLTLQNQAEVLKQ